MGFFDLFKKHEREVPPPLPLGLVYGDAFYSSPAPPAQYKQISFFVFNEQHMKEFIPMAFELINQILSPYYVVTYIKTDESSVDSDGKPKFPEPKTFLAYCHRFLSAFRIPNILGEQKNKLVVQTDFGNAPITNLLLDESSHGFIFSMCAYHEPIVLSTLEQSKAQLDNFDYIIRFDYDSCPQYLSIIFDTRIISIDDLKRIIAEICVRYGKELDSDL